MSEKLTKRVIDGLKPRERDYVVWDSKIKGFGARVWPSGGIVYDLLYMLGGGRTGTQRNFRIGAHGNITADDARKIAKKASAAVAGGGDPAGERAAARRMPTMAELAERYQVEYANKHKKPRTAQNDEILWRLHILPVLGRKRVGNVTRSEIERLQGSMREHRPNANSALALLSKAFNLAEVWGLRPDGSNPCRHIKRYSESKRERFLGADELTRLGAALSDAEREGTDSRSALAAIKLLLFTACRLSEIVDLHWQWVDF